MMTDVTFARLDPGLAAVLSAVGGDSATSQRLGRGMYLSAHWNFGDTISDKHDDYAELPGDLDAYGVCDSPDQWSERYAALALDPSRRFAVSFVRLRKATQPPSGGWRWHKWGTYIGTQEPQCEYLYDEPKIDEVYTFAVYEIGAGRNER